MILLADSEAACAGFTKGKADSKVSRMVVFTLSAIAAQRDISIWLERVPAEANPGPLPSRNRELSPPTGLRPE